MPREEALTRQLVIDTSTEKHPPCLFPKLSTRVHVFPLNMNTNTNNLLGACRKGESEGLRNSTDFWRSVLVFLHVALFKTSNSCFIARYLVLNNWHDVR